MSPLVIGLVGVVALVILMFAGVHIGFALALVGFLGILVLKPEAALGILQYEPYDQAAAYGYVVVPLFILVGEVALRGGVTRGMFDTAYKWLGRLPGGLGLTTIAASALFAANTGSSIASVMAIGKVALPEMKGRGYHPGFAMGILVAGGSLAVLIPPSVLLVVYGIVTETPIDKLLIAGILPGILTVGVLAGMIVIAALWKPQIAPRGIAATWRERLISIPKTWGGVVIALGILGGIYGGIVTVTEAAAIGVALVVMVALVLRGLTPSNFWVSLTETAKTTAMVFLILIGTRIFTVFLALSGVAAEFSEFVVGLPVPPLFILIGVLAMYFVLGTFLIPIAMILLTLPTVLPPLMALGYDPIWFAIIVVKLSEVGMMTPPVALNVFAAHAVDRSIPMSTVFRWITPFIGAELFSTALLVAFPAISLWLPGTMR